MTDCVTKNVYFKQCSIDFNPGNPSNPTNPCSLQISSSLVTRGAGGRGEALRYIHTHMYTYIYIYISIYLSTYIYIYASIDFPDFPLLAQVGHGRTLAPASGSKQAPGKA